MPFKKIKDARNLLKVYVLVPLLVLPFITCLAQIPASEVNWPVFMARQNLKWDNLG